MKLLDNIQKVLHSDDDIVNTLGNRPKNLTNENINIITSNYVASIKADGVRCFLYYGEKKVYSITNPFVEKEIKNNNTNKVCLFDCEYIEENNKYYIFDILIYDNKDVTTLTLTKRIKLISDDFLDDNIKMKEIHNLENNENIFTISKKIYNSKYDYNIDGIVYTPIYEPYKNNYIYKWKPLKQQTIDFLIRENSSTNNINKEFSLFVSSDHIPTKQRLLQDKRYNEWFPFITKDNDYYPSYFTPSSKSTFKVKLITNKNNIYGNYQNIVIKDNTIVEFYYDTEEKDEIKRWKPHRLRLDKTEGYLENFKKGIYEVTKGPNSWRTAMSIFNYIKNPIDEKVLFGEKDLENEYYINIKRKGLDIPLYKYNNFIKKFLYTKYLKKDNTVLDLAGGRGGDLIKLKNSSYVLHIDIVESLLQEAKNRHNKLNKKPDITFLQFNLLGNNTTKINKIKKEKKIEKFDIITCQFAFHYFCKNKNTIDFVIDIIAENLKKGGFFIMTGYDGSKIHTLLQKNEYKDFYFGKRRFAKIIPKYDTSKKFANYGQMISVWVEKIGLFQDEYLINIDYINKQMKKRNITLLENVSFGEKQKEFEGKSLSNEEIQYINYHNYFVFSV